MPSAQPTAAATSTAAPIGFGDNRGIKFLIRTGNANWTCVLQDRASYERTKAVRSKSTDSLQSVASVEST